MEEGSKQPLPMNEGVQGLLVSGVFWYFKREMNQKAIAARTARRQARTVVMATISALFVLSIAFFVVALVELAPKIDDLTFFRTLRPGYAGFFLAALFGCVLVYLRFDAAKTVRMPRRPENIDDVTTIPSLDVIEKKKDLSQLLSKSAQDILDDAVILAERAGHARVEAIHVFIAAMPERSVQMVFMRLGITYEQLKGALRRRMGLLTRGETVFGAEAHELVAQSFKDALMNGRTEIGVIELFASSYALDEFLQELFYSFDVELEEFKNVISWSVINTQLAERYKHYRQLAALKPTGAVNRAYTSVATPFLDSVSEDITLAGVRGQLPILIGRDREMNELMRAIEAGGQSIILVGPPGVGKGAVISGIAERMIEERVPKVLQDKRLVKLSLAHIVGVSDGSAQERLLAVMNEVARSGNIVLVIENVHELAQNAGTAVDLASVLATELEKGYTFLIATTTPQAYTKDLEQSVLGPKLSKVDVPEPQRNDAIRVLQSKLGAIENKHKVVFTYEAVAALVDLSMRYLHETFLPETAIILAKEVGLSVGGGHEDWRRVTKEDVATIVSEKSNVPVTQVSRKEGQELLNLEETMHARMIGQDEAVKAVASALRRARTELRSKNRPIANFLFLGPTGVGKTELAKTTAEVYFGSEDSMIRFDMSEYQDQASITRLIGSAGQAGLLTEAVRKQPYALLLLDELEKAHSDILNLFLQVMDDGRLTDGSGRTIDFTNIILIATSNAGTVYIQDQVANNVPLDRIKDALMENELKQVYRPEFLNRFDGIMVFKPLSQRDVVAIAYLMMKQVARRLEEKGIAFKATDQAVHELAQEGYDPKFGARPLRRVIQERVDNAVADVLLKGEVGRRDTLILQPGGVIMVDKAKEL